MTSRSAKFDEPNEKAKDGDDSEDDDEDDEDDADDDIDETECDDEDDEDEDDEDDYPIFEVIPEEKLRKIVGFIEALCPLWLQVFDISDLDIPSRKQAAEKKIQLLNDITKVNNEIAMVIVSCDLDSEKKTCVVETPCVFGFGYIIKQVTSLEEKKIDEILCLLIKDCRVVFWAEEEKKKKKKNAIALFNRLVSTIPKDPNDLLNWLSKEYKGDRYRDRDRNITFKVEKKVDSFSALNFISGLSRMDFSAFKYSSMTDDDNWKIVDRSSSFIIKCIMPAHFLEEKEIEFILSQKK